MRKAPRSGGWTVDRSREREREKAITTTCQSTAEKRNTERETDNFTRDDKWLIYLSPKPWLIAN